MMLKTEAGRYVPFSVEKRTYYLVKEEYDASPRKSETVISALGLDATTDLVYNENTGTIVNTIVWFKSPQDRKVFEASFFADWYAANEGEQP